MPGIRPRAINTDGLKTCSKCKLVKPLDQFFNYKRGKFGKEATCKDCKNIYQRSLLANNPEYKKRRDKNNADSFRRRKYGLTTEQIKKLLDSQNRCCAICNILLDRSESIKIPHIDHCHQSGEVRGILCSRCNTGLGSFRDSAEFLSSAISYLRDK